MVRARHGKPGPVYLDMPGNMLYEKVDESRVAPRPTLKEMVAPSPDNRSIEQAVELLRTARPKGDLHLPGRELVHVRYDLIARGFGAYGEIVEDPRSIRPALERGMKEEEKGQPALTNVVTEPTAMAQTVQFASYGDN
jgi:thiamine pyrophosphate-dependent acetolactate synthase large subunit-like protein